MREDKWPSVNANFLVVAISCIVLSNCSCDAFYPYTPLSSASFSLRRVSRAVMLHERKREINKAKGFGKKEDSSFRDETKIEKASEQPTDVSSSALQNVSFSDKEKENSIALTPEERTQQILRDRYGMKTLEEQQLDAVQNARRKEEQKKWAELKRKAETGDEFDLLAILPAPVIIGIDRFLKAGTALCGFIFVASGILIAVEAWSKASGDPLSPDFDDFIVHTIEPNFTPGLFVLLSFSVSLGLFASLQLGSQGASYKEK
jgi:hypothetical protein